MFTPTSYTRALLSFPTRRSSDLGQVRDGEAHVLDDDRRSALPDAPHRGEEPLPHPPEPGLQLGVTAELGRQSRSEEHTSELQSLRHLVCRLLLEKKKQNKDI